jgi:hypothetical protein
MKPSMSMTPESACCTTAGSRPPPFRQSRRDGSNAVTADLDRLFPEPALQGADRDRTAVEHRRGQCAVDVGLGEHVAEVFRRAGSARRDQRHGAQRARLLELRQVVALPHAVDVHAIEHDLAGAALLHLAHPSERVAAAGAAAGRVARVLVHAIAVRRGQAIDPDHDALLAELAHQLVDQLGALECGGVHGDLVAARFEHPARLVDPADPAGDAERNVERAADARDPVRIHAALRGTGADVVEHQLVRALVAVAQRQLLDLAHDDVVAEAHALHHLAVADIQARDDAAR